jgi:UDP:flavonoid glycosyltransferase YjiC (YdhE family)
MVAGRINFDTLSSRLARRFGLTFTVLGILSFVISISWFITTILAVLKVTDDVALVRDIIVTLCSLILALIFFRVSGSIYLIQKRRKYAKIKELNFTERTEDFRRINELRLKDLYGEKLASMGSARIAARLILAYIDKVPNYKNLRERAAEMNPEAGAGKLVVYSCHTGFLAHVGRSIMVAEELRRLGAEVVFVVDQETQDENGTSQQRKGAKIIHAHRFNVFHADTLDERIIMDYAQNHASWRFYSAKRIREECAQQMQALDSIRNEYNKVPDVVVTDFSPIMSISTKAWAKAERVKLPVVSVLNYNWTNYSTAKLSSSEADPTTRFFAFTLGWVWLNRTLGDSWLVNVLYAMYLIILSLPYNRVRFWLGLKLVRNFYAQMQGDLILMPDFAALDEIKISSKSLSIGPLRWEPKIDDSLSQLIKCSRHGLVAVGDEMDINAVAEKARLQINKTMQDFEDFIADRLPGIRHGMPLVYVTMGSSGTTELFLKVFEALIGKPYRVAVTSGSQFENQILGRALAGRIHEFPKLSRFIKNNTLELPTNFFIIPLYPGSLICEQAQMEINHGGSGSVYQAIERGIPMIMIATHADQEWCAEMAIENGFGVRLYQYGLTPAIIERTVEEMLNGNFLQGTYLHNVVS